MTSFYVNPTFLLSLDTKRDAIATAYVEFADNWQDEESEEWLFDPNAVPGKCVLGTMHGQGNSFEFSRPYGRLMDWWSSEFAERERLDAMIGRWVRLRLGVASEQSADARTVFVGRIEQPVDAPGADETRAIGRQTWIARGWDHWLNRIAMTRSYWQVGGEIKRMDWFPPVNVRGEGGVTKGNKSDQPTAAGIWTFGGTSVWRADEFLDYLWYYHISGLGDLAVEPSDPVAAAFVNSGPTISRRNAGDLLNYEPRISFPESQVPSALDVLNKLIRPEFGLDLAFREESDGMSLDVYPIAPDIPELQDIDAPKNTRVVPLYVGDDPRTRAVIEDNSIMPVDRIRIEGERIISCFTMGKTYGPGTLAFTEGWSQAELDAYKSGAGAPAEDYEDREHDAARSEDRFSRVYSEFVASSGFNYDSGYANPRFTRGVPQSDDGEYTVEPYAWQNWDSGTLPTLPLRRDMDYTTNPPIGLYGQIPADVPEYLPMFALARVPDEVHGLEAMRWCLLDRVREFNPSVPSAHILALEGQVGFRIECSPRHALARDGWDIEEHPSEFDPSAAIDYNEMLATVAVRTDHRLFAEYTLPDGLRPGDGSVMVLRYDGAEAWWLSRQTVLGVEANGVGLRRSPESGYWIRNDMPILRRQLAGAVARYMFRRTAASVRYRGLLAVADYLGAIGRIETEGMRGRRGAITGVVWRFDPGETTILCGQAESGG